MRTSIPIRLAIVVNLVIVSLGAGVAWVGITVSGQAIERRLVEESVTGAAALVRQMDLPITDTLMQRLEKILGSPVMAVEMSGPGAPRIVASSLPTAATASLGGEFHGQQLPRQVQLGSTIYRIGLAGLKSTPAGPASANPSNLELLLLVPVDRIEAARHEVASTIAWYTAGATVLATLVTLLLALTVSRPLRKLADRMRDLAARAQAGQLEFDESLSPAAAQRTRPGPAEVAALAEAFDQLLANLRQAREQLARSSRMAALGQLSASVAHELRNPLSGIKMNARVLADELKQAGVRDQSMDLILREIDRMDQYLQELLDIATSEIQTPGASTTAANTAAVPANQSPGTAVPGSSTANLAQLCDSVLQLLAPRLRHAKIQIVKNYDPCARPASADGDRIRRVIMNLVINALDAMPADGQLTLKVSASEDHTVRFSVGDTGGGVQVPAGTDIFEPFMTTKSHGTGLGLHVSKRIVTRFGGQIHYTTTPQGSTFWFDLPASS